VSRSSDILELSSASSPMIASRISALDLKGKFTGIVSKSSESFNCSNTVARLAFFIQELRSLVIRLGSINRRVVIMK